MWGNSIVSSAGYIYLCIEIINILQSVVMYCVRYSYVVRACYVCCALSDALVVFYFCCFVCISLLFRA